MSRRSVLRRLFDPILALSVLAGTQVSMPLLAQVPGGPQPPRFPGTAPSPQVVPADFAGPLGQPLRYARNVAGEAAPIVLAADSIATWYESDQTVVVLLRGKAYVQQGTVQVRCDQAIARFDLKNHRDKGIWQMDLYAEGQVRLDTSADTKEGARATVDLATRGEIKLHSVKAKTVQQAQSDDPLYRRAIAERAQSFNQQGTIQPVGLPSMPGMPVPITPPAPQYRLPPSGVTPMSPPPPAAPYSSPSSPAPVKPLSAAPASGGDVVRGAMPDQDRPVPFLIAQGPPPDPSPPANNVPVQPSLPGSPIGGPAAIAPLGPPSTATPRPTSQPVLGPGRTFAVRPRFGTDFQLSERALGNGEEAYIITGGVIINFTGAPRIGQVDLEADKCVIFKRGKAGAGGGFRQTQTVGDDTKIQFYLAGNVEIREQDPKRGERVLRADEIYYDIDRNVAIALSARFEMRQPNLPDPIQFKADELIRTSKDTYEILRGEVSASKLPSDPGLKLYFTTATIEEKSLPKLSIFGQEVVDRATGKTIIQTEDYIRAHNVFFELENVPFFYLPYLAGDARNPLGPIESLSAGYNKIYGAQFNVTLNAYELIGIQPLEGTHWRIMLDELTARGPGFGTQFEFAGKEFLGLPSKSYDGFFRGWGIYDHGEDNLGGPRPVPFVPTAFRGRAIFREAVFDLPYGFTVQTQLAAVSDRNFLEAYYKQEFDTDLNQNSYLYVKQQGDYWALTGLVGGRLGREWITETEWLPRVDGFLLGLSPFDQFTYNAHASAAYARLRTSNDPNFTPLSPTDQNDSTGRLDLIQELSLPFYLGPVKVVPFAELDLAGYSNDLNGDPLGRAWGAAGVRASIPFTRLFPDARSELMNVNGINHKIVLSSNYLYSNTTDAHYLVPQLDRLNDDAGDQAVRDVRLFGYGFLPPGTRTALLNSPLYDPQVYAMRRLLDTNPDSLDRIQVLQLDLHQRWQTKRGYPGAEHIIDWMTLDLSASVFPEAKRDNFGKAVSFLEYDWTWNLGDRTALASSGFVDPIENGAKIFTVGAFLNRPDRTNFYLGYRQIEPLESRQVSGSVTYVFSPKYAMTLGAALDLGPSHAQTNSLVMSRVGTDLQVNLGVTYNSLQQNLGFIFEIVPNLLSGRMHGAGTSTLGALSGGR